MKKEKQPKDLTFKLTKKNPGISCMLNSRSTRANPLHWFDEENGVNKVLRYASNQKSVFEDEQDGTAIIEPIIFEDGMLFVPKTNPALQKFLQLHPRFGKDFVIQDNARDAQEELETLELSTQAAIECKNLDLDKMLMIARVQLGLNTDNLSTPEVKRDVFLFAKNNPQEFLDSLEDTEMEVLDIVTKSFNNGLLKTRKNDTEVWFGLPNNKTKMMNVKFGEDVKASVASFLKTDDGIKVMEMLESNLG